MTAHWPLHESQERRAPISEEMRKPAHIVVRVEASEKGSVKLPAGGAVLTLWLRDGAQRCRGRPHSAPFSSGPA